VTSALAVLALVVLALAAQAAGWGLPLE